MIKSIQHNLNNVIKSLHHKYNINWRDVQRKNVVNNVDMSSFRAPWQIGPYTETYTDQDKVHQETTYMYIQKKTTILLCFPVFFCFIYNILNDFSKKCCVTALVRSMAFIGGLNQF